MRRQKVDSILLCVSIGSFLLMALALLLTPVQIATIGSRAMSVLVGSLFWGFFTIGVVMQGILAKRRKTWIERNRTQCKRGVLYARVGVFAFAQNIFGCIADVISGLSLLVLIIALVLTKGVGYICCIAQALFVFAFCLHCILNGKIFYYVQNQDTFLSDNQRKKQIKKEEENEVWLISKIR